MTLEEFYNTLSKRVPKGELWMRMDSKRCYFELRFQMHGHEAFTRFDVTHELREDSPEVAIEFLSKQAHKEKKKLLERIG